MIRKIKLKKGKSVLVDSEDYEFLIKYKWYFKLSDIVNGKEIGYAVRLTINPKETIYMHKQIMKTSDMLDHIDGNKLNNQKANLRKCSHVQNCQNQGLRINNTTGAKGVSKIKDKSLYQCHIRYGGKKHILGRFKNIIEAAKAYDEAAIKYHGEFAKTNKQLGVY